MPQTRKRIRDAIRAALADPAAGFNARLDELAPGYGIAPFAIDWAPGSGQFFEGFLLADQLELSQIVSYPAIVLYTSSAVNQNLEKFSLFAGPVTAHVDLYLKFEEGMEGDDTESVADAAEDALLTVLNDPQLVWPAGVVWNGDWSAERDPLRLIAAGWEQRIPVAMTFEVHL